MGFGPYEGQDQVTAVKRPEGYRSRNFVLRTFPGIHEAEELAEAFFWTRVRVQPPGPQDDRIHIRWDVSPDIAYVLFVADPAIATSYLTAVSPVGPEMIDTLTTLLEASEEVIPPDELLKAVDEAGNGQDKALALLRAGLGAPLTSDPRLVKRIEAGARDRDPQVRGGALWGVVFSECPVFRRLLAQSAVDDPEAALRQFADGALATFDRMGLPAP